MDDEDFFEYFHELFEADDEEPDPDAPPGSPTYRATVVGRRVTLVCWMPLLMSGPGAGAAFREREAAGVTVADLTTAGEGPAREVTVEFHARGDAEQAERALEEWAQLAGYRRIWFPDRVVGFDECPPLRAARVTCPACRHAYREQRAEFWLDVHRRGCFPNYCLVCGHDLPQWEGQ